MPRHSPACGYSHPSGLLRPCRKERSDCWGSRQNGMRLGLLKFKLIPELLRLLRAISPLASSSVSMRLALLNLSLFPLSWLGSYFILEVQDWNVYCLPVTESGRKGMSLFLLPCVHGNVFPVAVRDALCRVNLLSCHAVQVDRVAWARITSRCFFSPLHPNTHVAHRLERSLIPRKSKYLEFELLVPMSLPDSSGDTAQTLATDSPFHYVNEPTKTPSV